MLSGWTIVEKGVSNEVGDAAADELLQRRGGGDPVEVGAHGARSYDAGAAARLARPAERIVGGAAMGVIGAELFGQFLDMDDLNQGVAVAADQST